MAATIKSIHIENFRSIRTLDADLSSMSIFVGNNDSGKSNIFRALNLFFNGYTNPGIRFSFDEDYNFFAPTRIRKAKEVVVRLEIALPESYHQTNGHVVIWEKAWRADGLWGGESQYYGQRISKNRRGREVRRDVKIPERSNVHALLRKIDFEYVPAIKDSKYFDDLRGRIYGIISSVAARTFHDSSAAFERSIGDHLGELTVSIAKSLGFDTRLALPRDLSHIFERLDFLSGAKSVSLSNRGDGIKARHIPLILKFMAEKKADLQRRGGPPISSIWAYEEPENNLEIASAVQLSDELLDFAQAGISQILLTTHSPAFYDIGQNNQNVSLNFVVRTADAEGTIIKSDSTGIDESLGTLALLAPRISELVAKIREQELARHEAERLARLGRPQIFVEGESDKIILERSLQIFYPELIDAVSFETKRDGAGHSYVLDMLSGWRSQHKHHTDRPKAAGIVDGDASSSRDEFNKQPDNIKSAKCFCYPKSDPLRGALAAGFKVPATLETLYPLDVWVDAKNKGILERRNPANVYPAHLTRRILEGDAKPGEGLQDAWSILVEYDFKSEEKIKLARKLCQGDQKSCEKILTNFKSILNETLKYLALISK